MNTGHLLTLAQLCEDSWEYANYMCFLDLPTFVVGRTTRIWRDTTLCS